VSASGGWWSRGGSNP